MVFKVLCCALLACTLVQAQLPNRLGLYRTAVDPVPHTFYGDVEKSFDKTRDGIINGFNNGLNAGEEAMDNVKNFFESAPSFAQKLLRKFWRRDISEVKGTTADAPSAQCEQSVDPKLPAFPDSVKAAASEILDENNEGIKEAVNAGVDAASNTANAVVATATHAFKGVLTVPRIAFNLAEKIGESDNSKVESNTEAAKAGQSGKPVGTGSKSIIEKLKDASSDVFDQNNEGMKKVFNAGVDAADSTGKAIKATGGTFMKFASSPFRLVSKTFGRWF